MKSKKIIIFFVCFNLNLIRQYDSFATNSQITITGFGKFLQDIQTPLQSKQLNILNSTQQLISNSFALSNSLGTYIPKTHIQKIHISIGNKISFTERLQIEGLQMQRIETYIPKIQVGLPGSLFSDTIQNLDFIINIFYIPPVYIDYDLQKFSFFSIGLTPRFNFIKGSRDKNITQWGAAWGGLTFALGFDYTNIDFQSNNSKQLNIKGKSNQDYIITTQKSNYSWNLDVFTITPEIMTSASIGIVKILIGGGFVLDLGKNKFNAQVESKAISKSTFKSEPGKIQINYQHDGKVFLPYYRVVLSIQTKDFINLTLPSFFQAFAEQETIYGFGFGISFKF